MAANSNLTPFTVDDGSKFAFTFTLHTAALPPSTAITIIDASPLAMADTLPVASTVATSGFDDSHDTLLSVAFSGRMATLRVTVSPSLSSRVFLSSFISVIPM